MPLAETAIDKSVTSLVTVGVLVSGESEGYDEWRRAFDAGSASIFTTTVADGVDFVAQTLIQ